jgi:hypothetical protein
LIRSVYENVPLPSILLYQRFEEGRLVYDVIDGKQRIETILMFLGARRFGTRSFPFLREWRRDGEQLTTKITWKQLKPLEQQKILSYPIDTITVEADLSDIAQIFVRINSTGSSLTGMEVRSARFLQSAFLKRCKQLADAHFIQDFLRKNHILSAQQVRRMKHVELVAELLLSLVRGSALNKKEAIDEAMKPGSVSPPQTKKAEKQLLAVLRTIRALFPQFGATRFARVSDFYTLVLLVWRWQFQEKLVLKNKKRRVLANSYLTGFAQGVDEVSDKQRRFISISEDEKDFAAYLLTVREGTDRGDQREKRQQILAQVFKGCFEAKDPMRVFSLVQRRIIWLRSDKRCADCGAGMRTGGYHVDHIQPYAHGGKTALDNAQILCPKCNRRKSDRG